VPPLRQGSNFDCSGCAIYRDGEAAVYARLFAHIKKEPLFPVFTEIIGRRVREERIFF